MIGAHELTIRAGISYRQLDVWTRTRLGPFVISERAS